MRSLATLPKAELHLHIEGTFEPELFFALAQRNGLTPPATSVDELRARYAFTNLQSFLDLYYANMAVLQTREDFADLAEAYFRRAAADGVTYAEVFFDPQAHTSRGVELEEVVEGLVEGCERGRALCVDSALIACFLRDRPTDEALDVLEQLVAIDAPIIGIGLDSKEVGNPAAQIAPVFARAGELGLHRVAHAGEEGGPEYIADALDLLGAERIDHGIHAIDDPAVLQRLVDERIPLTVCPLSNVRLQTVTDLSTHPLPSLLDADVLVTINSDDPAYFGGYLNANFEAIREAFGLTDEVLAQLARNSFAATFLPEAQKAKYVAAVDEWLATA